MNPKNGFEAILDLILYAISCEDSIGMYSLDEMRKIDLKIAELKALLTKIE